MGLIVETFAKRGKAYINHAMNTVKSYERFCAAHSTQIADAGNPYPPSELLVGWFAIWRLDGTRALKARTGVPFKGSSGESAVKGLLYSRTL